MVPNAMTRVFPALLTLLVVNAYAFAHKINVFAAVEGDRIRGECYSSGGGHPKDCLVEFFGPGGEKLGETRTDADGKFSFKPGVGTDHRIVIDTGDGHRAEFVVRADELSAALASPAVAPPSAGSKMADTAPDIEKRVADAVAREFLPLRRQMDQMEKQYRLRDILGGIGYIVGLAGLILYFKSRRKSRMTND